MNNKSTNMIDFIQHKGIFEQCNWIAEKITVLLGNTHRFEILIIIFQLFRKRPKFKIDTDLSLSLNVPI